MGFLNKIQNLPEKKKKIILWSVVIIIGFFLFWFYIQNILKIMKPIDKGKMKEELQIQQLEEELKKLPKFKIPEIK